MRLIGDGVHVIEARDHRVMPWKNGLGTTREIAVSHHDGGGFDWRLSIADVAVNGPFSAFPGYRRTIMLLQGAGMALQAGDTEAVIDRPFAPFDFDGGAATTCRLLDGAVRDFNIISRLPYHYALLREFPYQPQPSVEPAACALFCLRGGVRVSGHPLAAEELLLATNAAWFAARKIQAASADAAALWIAFYGSSERAYV